MKRKPPSLKALAWLGLLVSLALSAGAQSLFDQKALLYNTENQRGVNWQSQRGVPISDVADPATGSDGRNSMQPSAPTPNQFRGAIVYGGVTKKGRLNGNISGTTFAATAESLDWPRSKSGPTVVLVLRATVGAPYLSKQVGFLYGGVIPPPKTDVAGNPLTGTTPDAYWVREPFTTNNHAGTAYYWSPHAQVVFAVQPGTVDITWRRAAALTNTVAFPPAGYPANEGINYTVLGGVFYELRKVTEVVSGIPVKTPQKMFWTEGIYAATGKMVTVPDGRVKEIKFLFNSTFPELVATNEIAQPYNLPITDVARRTLFFQNKLITAYNREGRVFMELLGDSTGTARRFLGFELVDVQREAIPNDITIELGERVTAYPGGVPADADLQPSPIQTIGEKNFAYQRNVGTDGRTVELYATRETVNLSDYQVHWLVAGVEGIRWPLQFSRYKFVWPSEAAKYSHYVRPVVLDENEAVKTAVQLTTDNVPTIEYEDPSDRVRARLTPDFKFYTFMDETFPTHRTLIRFNVGDFVRFERVFSVLETTLKSPGFERSGLNAAVLNLNPTTNPAFGQLPVGTYFNGGSFTVESWVNVRSHRNGARLFDFGNGPDNNNVFLALSDGTTGVPMFGIRSIFAPANLKATNALPLNEWVHVAVVFDASNTNGAIYINGGQQTNAMMVKPADVVRTNNFIGRSSYPGDDYADAQFDNFRIWSVARTATEISDSLYTHVPSGTAGLVAQYEFHEDAGTSGSATVALDGGGTGLTMSLINASLTPALTRPRIVETTAWVGQRLTAPGGESTSVPGLAYLAGYVHQPRGTPFSVTAYQDPFVVGFEEAAAGSIIPVNAGNDDAQMEVWWYRKNGADTTKGFKPVYWPSVIARYTLRWPTSAPHSRDLILASNAGSGPLSSFESRGGLYFQNDRSLPGYNPNEEHAVLQGGQAWALRDDLNVTSGTNYSSRPYVLLEYPAADGRPSMTAFQVFREKGNVKFDYQFPAGLILQAPMPLPLLDRPLAPPLVGEAPLSFNVEVANRDVDSVDVSEAGGFSQVTVSFTARHFFLAYEKLALQNVPDSGAVTTRWLYTTNSDQSATNVSGVISTNEPYVLGLWTSDAQPAQDARYKYRVANPTGIVVGKPVLVANSALATNWVVNVTGTNIVNGNHYVEVEFPFGSANGNAPVQTANVLVAPGVNVSATGFDGWRVAYEKTPESVADTDLRDFYASFTFQDRKGDVWVYRGPHKETDTAKMVMQFYYKTLAGFNYPDLALDAQPPIGTITPYLRPQNSDGTYSGDAVFGYTTTDRVGDGNPLGIVYHPVWPEGVPVLQMAESLTLPKRGLPSVRGQTSLEVLYQQPQYAGGIDNRAAVLHDPTREHQFDLLPEGSAGGLDKIPDSVSASDYRGKTFFPNLPPHLVERFFYDPNRGAHGALVFKGQFVDEVLGEDYLLLNALSSKDQDTLRSLCLVDDDHKAQWDNAITNGLVTLMQTFMENPAKPGTYIADTNLDVTINPGDLSAVTDSETAVDSYALSAVGPGVGYITLVAGNGRAFTPKVEPVSVKIIRVVDMLYRGEVKVVKASNPLAEKLTLQQVVDLAGLVDDYRFEWMIAAPVDGAPPPVYLNTRRLLLGNGTWNHVRHPLPSDLPATIHTVDASRRVAGEVTPGVIPLTQVPFTSVSTNDGKLSFLLTTGQSHLMAKGNLLVARESSGLEVFVTVDSMSTVTVAGRAVSNLIASIDDGQNNLPASMRVLQLYERVVPAQRQSIVFREFPIPNSATYSQYFLSLELNPALGAKVYVDGQLVVTANRGADDTSTTTAPPTFLPLGSVYRLGPELFAGGQRDDATTTHRVAVELFSTALPGAVVNFNLRLEAYEAVDQTSLPGSQWLALDPVKFPEKVRTILGENADVRALSDNYVICRYRATNENHVSFPLGFSQWTDPALAEGWIKRVLGGINPFNQRVGDFFNNSVNTDTSILTLAGTRWEGDVALNLDSINSYGLIAIYETVLRRGKDLSINSGINYGPANDALLLVAGYLNDLYMIVGNEASADAANPTIGIGSKDNKFGDIATALFAFKGQMSSLLEEELALLRGRDDFLQPGVQLAPVYNRLVWNYTRGIDAGEVIYSLNYNILDQTSDGVVSADDAAKLFPQGHGDAYGHYLTATKGYYSLLIDKDFDWVPRIEAVNVLGKPVAVDYQDERKFAAAAAAIARTGRQIFDLTWRRDYKPGADTGWNHFNSTRVNSTKIQPTTRYWGLDHWAARTAQGAYVNWAMGNAILPAVDPDPTHEGIQKVDRTTVPELTELALTMADLQTSLDNAEGHLTPLGLTSGSLAFDINPNQITGSDPATHFEQIYSRATRSLNNALAAFDDAKDVTRFMRSDSDSVADLKTAIEKQELAYTNALIELYGTPYPDDVGPGKTYKQGYAGPDLIHFMYVELPESTFNDALTPKEELSFKIDLTMADTNLNSGNLLNYLNFNFVSDATLDSYTNFLEFKLGPHGFFDKPDTFAGKRESPGRLQQLISDQIKAQERLRLALKGAEDAKGDFDRALALFKAHQTTHATIRGFEKSKLIAESILAAAEYADSQIQQYVGLAKETAEAAAEAANEAIPKTIIAGLAAGGDVLAPAAAAPLVAEVVVSAAFGVVLNASSTVVGALGLATGIANAAIDYDKIAPAEWDDEMRQAVSDLEQALGGLQDDNFPVINARLREYDDAQRAYRAAVASGIRIQSEREIFRQRSAAAVQGFRTRDAAFRVFRNEKLERYKALFDLSARYAFLAANAYDYETGLLATDKGKAFINRIVNSRALGVVKSGEPQYAGSNTGDPGISGALAEMKADWDVLKGRLGFNNPAGYGTTVSLRTENHRIIPGTNGLIAWKDILNAARKANVLEDTDVRRYCMQIDRGNGLPVPGLVIEFSTTIADGHNFFGRPLAGGDHYFDPSYFATKIFSVGVAFEGYQGMDNPVPNSGAVSGAGGTSPPDPSAAFLDPLTLAATPGIYLVPVGVDSMRSPALGDAGAIRSWSVDDVTIPLPFNIGGSDFSTKPFYQASDSLSEPLFGTRKHATFRPVSTTAAFTSSIYGGAGNLQMSQFTNTRLIGRSVWNSRWKLVIPGHKLLNDPDEGLERFLNTVTDIKLHLVTYSYAGN